MFWCYCMSLDGRQELTNEVWEMLLIILLERCRMILEGPKKAVQEFGMRA